MADRSQAKRTKDAGRTERRRKDADPTIAQTYHPVQRKQRRGHEHSEMQRTCSERKSDEIAIAHQCGCGRNGRNL